MIQNSDFHSDNNFESHLLGNGMYKFEYRVVFLSPILVGLFCKRDLISKGAYSSTDLLDKFVSSIKQYT